MSEQRAETSDDDQYWRGFIAGGMVSFVLTMLFVIGLARLLNHA